MSQEAASKINCEMGGSLDRQILRKVPKDTTDRVGISFQPAIVATRLDLTVCDIAPSAKISKHEQVKAQPTRTVREHGRQRDGGSRRHSQFPCPCTSLRVYFSGKQKHSISPNHSLDCLSALKLPQSCPPVALWDVQAQAAAAQEGSIRHPPCSSSSYRL